MASVVLAIDPGSAKCGLAAVDSGGAVLHRAVVATGELPAALRRLTERFSPEAILIGDGTGADSLYRSVENLGLPPPLIRVDERHTSEQARARYVAETPARGWRRLVPRALRSPDAPYDDYVALILAERWWAQWRQSGD